MITNGQSGTRIEEIATGIYGIHTPVSIMPGGFSFNQILIKDDQPLLFHTGPRSLFPLVREAVATVLPPGSLRFVGFSHHENDEDGSLDLWLETAPAAEPLSGRISAMLNGELGARPPRALGDGESLSLGAHSVSWHDAAHLPHAWECGYLFESTTRTLFCGDLFTQPGDKVPPINRSAEAILEPSEGMRAAMNYFSCARGSTELLEKLAVLDPRLLATMHGSAFEGDGAGLLRELGRRLGV